MAKKNVRDEPLKPQVSENEQMSDIVFILDKMELILQAVSKIGKDGKLQGLRSGSVPQPKREGVAPKTEKSDGCSTQKMTGMEIVCIDKQTFDELRVRFGKLEEKVMGMCRPVEDLGLKKWLDNQEVCEILRISKKTLQVYRDKGILPYSRIKHKIFFKTEDVHKLLESNYYHLKREL